MRMISIADRLFHVVVVTLVRIYRDCTSARYRPVVAFCMDDGPTIAVRVCGVHALEIGGCRASYALFFSLNPVVMVATRLTVCNTERQIGPLIHQSFWVTLHTIETNECTSLVSFENVD